MSQRIFHEQEAKLLEEIILSRRDVRGNKFLDVPIPDPVVERILLAALHAPSVGFSQPWEFVVIKDPSIREQVRNSFTEENNAAVRLFDGERSEKYQQMKLEGILESYLNIAVFYRPSESTVLGQTSMKEAGLYSVVCAIQNMWLMARALNVGVGWVSILDPRRVKQILRAPQNNQLVAYLCLGYVDEFLPRPELEILQWEKRKILNDLVFADTYKAPAMKTFNIEPASKEIVRDLQHKIDFKTKPPGALGQLEKIALQAGCIQNTLAPVLRNPHLVVFAADHGITLEGVSAYPQEVTFQMVMNFLNGGAAINVFCRQNKIAIRVVDAGVNYIFPPELNVIDAKAGMGTKSFLHGPAMTEEEALLCLEKGSSIVHEIYRSSCNVIGFGEMGIGNTSSASALMSVICKLPVEQCVGRGTGVDDKGLSNKINIIKRAISANKEPASPVEALATFGGFEIAQICGAMLQAAEYKMIILVDGFISTAAFLVAHKINPAIMDYAIFCHQSDEQGHANMLNYLGARPLLNLGMRLGEGTGAAVGYPLVQAAVNFLNEMASFDSAGVSNKEERKPA